MVDVEHGALRTFEENRLAIGKRSVEQVRSFCHVRANTLCQRQVSFADLVDRVGRKIIDLREDLILQLEHGGNLLAEDRFIHHVLDADAAAGNLVFISRTDAALRRANEFGAALRFTRAIQIDVIGHDNVSIARNEHAIGRKACFVDGAHLFNEHVGVDHAAIADDRRNVIVHNSRRDEVKGKLRIARDNRMPCVVPSLIAHNVVVVLCDQVGDLAFAFIAPLGA